VTVHPGVESPAGAGRLLVVDDEANICALLSATLRLTGFEVRVAASGQEALTAAAEFEPDLVVLDVMLPDLDVPYDTRRSFLCRLAEIIRCVASICVAIAMRSVTRVRCGSWSVEFTRRRMTCEAGPPW
jgi:DNA-binding NarL/FixJ family response regulator